MNPSTEKIGNVQLLKLFKTAFICSRIVPEKQERVIFNWVKQLNPLTDCILCGNCFVNCPQNAKVIRYDLNQVKSLIKEGKKVVASLAPSFVANVWL